MFAVYHEDKYTLILLKVFEREKDAVDYLYKHYAHRLHPGRDKAFVYDDKSVKIAELEVDYMPQFEAVKTWSFSGSAKLPYITQLNSTGMLSCNCKGWTFKREGKPRQCKHIDEVVMVEGYKTVVNGQYIFIQDKKLKAAKSRFSGASTPEQKFLVLVEDYEKAINKMCKLDPKHMLDMAEEVEMCKFKVESYMLMLETQGIDAMVRYEAAQSKLGTLS